ncbi:hypothetical protein G5I_06406 [Acromyrmex echinatior]|uniref:Uncharacterized protein n=1 Tax=Acromyrmex echinatior TaxID=103372 RepID=F4WKY5_ACREC|nr:hypothetical protein G5I_06406 [Acromyrmex echinatior]
MGPYVGTDVPSVQLVPQDPPSQGCEGSQRKDLLPVPRHVSSVSRHPDDETSANAFKCGRRLVTRPAQGDAHLQFESAVNIEILEFTPTNLASHSGRAQSPLRQYYMCTIWDNFHSGHFSSVLPRTATIHAGRAIEKLADHSNDSGDAQEGDKKEIKGRKKVDRKKGGKEKEPQRSGFKVSGAKWPAEGIELNIFKMIRNTPSGDFRSKSSWTIKSSLNQKEDIKDKSEVMFGINNCIPDLASAPNDYTGCPYLFDPFAQNKDRDDDSMCLFGEEKKWRFWGKYVMKLILWLNYRSVHAWEERILVTQFASATAGAVVAASLAADANFLPMSEQAHEGEGQGRKIRINCEKIESRENLYEIGLKIRDKSTNIAILKKKCIQISPGVTKPKYNGDKSSLAVRRKTCHQHNAKVLAPTVAMTDFDRHYYIPNIL